MQALACPCPPGALSGSCPRRACAPDACRVRPQAWAGGTFKRLGPLTFARVARAGHMVPMDQPVAALQLIQQWLASGQPLPRKARSLL